MSQMIRKSLVIILLSAVFMLGGCGAGESARNNSTAGISKQQSKTLSKTTQRLVPISSSQQAQLNQSIAKIRSNPLSKDFAITSSYPYVITGNLTQPEVEHWKSRIQRTQSAVKSMYFTKEPSEVVQIWLFKDAPSYFRYNQLLWNASPGTGYGYYLPKQKRMMMNIASGGGTLTHELVHPYVEANFGGKVYGSTNWRLKGLQAVINANAMPSLQEMMKTNRGQFLGPNRNIYYAQARYLMFYLQSKGLLEKYYHQFVASVTSDPTGINTLLGLTGMTSMESLEIDWTRFVKGLRF